MTPNSEELTKVRRKFLERSVKSQLFKGITPPAQNFKDKEKKMSIERILELAWLKAVDNWAIEKERNDENPSEWQKQKEQIAWKEVKTIEYLRKEVKAAK